MFHCITKWLTWTHLPWAWTQAVAWLPEELKNRWRGVPESSRRDGQLIHSQTPCPWLRHCWKTTHTKIKSVMCFCLKVEVYWKGLLTHSPGEHRALCESLSSWWSQQWKGKLLYSQTKKDNYTPKTQLYNYNLAWFHDYNLQNNYLAWFQNVG